MKTKEKGLTQVSPKSFQVIEYNLENKRALM